MIPGDNENDPIEILRYYYIMNSVDILIPFVSNIEMRKFGRRLISSLYRLIINLSFGTTLNYTNGTVLYRRILLTQITNHSNGFFYQAELLVKLIRSGYLYAEVPQIINQRINGRTKAISFKSLINVIKSYIKLSLSIHIIRNSDTIPLRILENTATFDRLNNLRS
jgi:hypothetical protein